jgi:hypothetical protein
MKLRPLIINEKFNGHLSSLKTYAESNPVTMDMMLDALNDKVPLGDDAGRTILIPVGYLISFTIEQQNPGNVRHLSMSVQEKGKLPNEHAVQEIMNHLGFEKELKKCMVRLEEFEPGHEAINVMELIKK